MKLITSLRLMALACTLLFSRIVLATPSESSKNQVPPSSSSMVFIENKGQVTDQFQKQRTDIDFKLSAPGMNIFIGNGQIHYMWQKAVPRPKPQATGNSTFSFSNDISGRDEKHMPDQQPVETYRMDVVLLGADSRAQLVLEDRQEYHENYYSGYFEGKVHSYKKAIYRNVYPNIDWVLYTYDNQLKYDFIVHPGGNPSDIKLQYNGATALTIKDGAFTATTPFGSITEQAPYTYDALTKAKLPSSFSLNENVLSFKLSGNSVHDMVIDPTLLWTTYYGGPNGDWVYGVRTYHEDKVFICGETGSSFNIATTGAFKSSVINGSGGECFIVLFNAAGQRKWATYYGGSDYDMFYSIDLDASGGLYATGITLSDTGIATSGAYRTSRSGTYLDNMLVKFDSSGSRIWGTYFGGARDELEVAVACDTKGNVYITGRTESDTGIASSGSVHQSAFAGGNVDGYLAKFNSAGTLQWSTYVGGSAWEWIHDIDCDTAGNVYIAGNSTSDTGIATVGSYLSSKPASGGGFLAKFTGSGIRSWGTYYGSASCGHGILGIEVDNKDNLYVAGSTACDDAGTSGLDTLRSGHDGLLAKFNLSGYLQWATYVGGNDQGFTLPVEELADICIGANGKLYGIGFTGSWDIATTGAWKSNPGYFWDIFLAEFDTSGNRTWTTLFGGSSYEDLFSVWIDGNTLMCNTIAASPTGAVYFGLNTNSSSGVATSGAHQAVPGNYEDGAIGCMIVDTAMHFTLPDTVMCTGTSFMLNYSVIQQFRSANTFAVQLSNPGGSFASPTIIGSTSAVSSGSISCTLPTTLASGNYQIRIVSNLPVRTSLWTAPIAIYPPPAINAGIDTMVCEGDTIKLNVSSSSAGTIGYTWAGPGSYAAATKSIKRISATTAMAGNYIVTATRGCIVKDTVVVTINTNPAKPIASYTAPLCIGDTLHLSSTITTGATYLWTGSNNYNASIRQPDKVITQLSDSGFYIVKVTVNGCISLPDTVNVKLNKVSLDVTVSPNDTICQSVPVTFTALSQTGTVAPSFLWYKGSSLVSGATSNIYSAGNLLPADSIIYCSMTVNGACAYTVMLKDTVKMLVKPIPGITASSNSPLCEDDTLKLFCNAVITGNSFLWSGPGMFTDMSQHLARYPVNLSMSGSYIITATAGNGCSASDTVTVIVHPMAPTPVISSDTVICLGDTLHLNASAVSGATYIWSGPNGFASQSKDTLRTDMQITDSGYYRVSAIINNCPSIPDSVWVGVLPALDLAVEILADPDIYLNPDDTVTLTASLPNGGVLLHYQWYRNGVLMPSDTSATWTTTGLSQGDTAVIVVTTDYPCVISNTASDTVYFRFPVSASNLNGRSALRLYPNPNKGNFTVQGIAGEKADIEIVNAIGQIVYKDKMTPVSGTININTKLPIGNFLLKVRVDGGIEVLRFTVLE